nr:MAG TPA: hypothetical protein [Bacteriophage sp.]
MAISTKPLIIADNQSSILPPFFIPATGVSYIPPIFHISRVLVNLFLTILSLVS